MNELLVAADGWPTLLGGLLAWGAGLGLGLIFFGGLWWTVRRAALSPQPAGWFFGSLVLRMAAVLWGFHAVGGGHWARLLACLFGFAVARLVVARWTRPAVAHAPAAQPDARHAA